MDANLHDSELLAKIRASNADALGVLAHRYGALLVRIATAITGSVDQSQDIVQDVLFRLWRQRETLPDVENVVGYLTRAVRNQAHNALREQISTEERQQRWSAATLPTASYNSANIKLDNQDRLTTLRRTLDSVPARCREIFLLHWQHDYTQQEIAKLLGISLRTVQNQISRAMRSLIEGAEHLSKGDFE